MNGRVIAFPAVPQSPEMRDDSMLLAACAAGDADALDLLFERHRVSVTRYLARMLGNGGELEDLVQATFLEAWKSAGRFQGRASVRSWLLGIANNLFRHHVRSESRKRTALHVLAAYPSGPGSQPDEEASRRELIRRVERALLALPHHLRSTFVLCELEEVPREEAAEILGVSLGSIGRRVHEARKAIREAIEGVSS
jgi:RNA polymerase sigma factor (sigma-70 family)